MAQIKRVNVIGLGYIGLPTAAILALKGFSVIGVDTNERVVEIINSGKAHIVEKDLDAVVCKVVFEEKFIARLRPQHADVFIIAVPTPTRNGNQPDLSYVEGAARDIAPVLEKGNLVILESTSPVGSTEQLCHWFAEERPDLTFPHQHGGTADVRVAHCPERVLPGKILRELVENDRVVGGMSPVCSKCAGDFYSSFIDGECLLTDAATAEMCKLAENAFRDVNIAFANELSLICDRLGIDVWRLIALANRHPRVNILQPGPGVGGHCIAVDPWFIYNSAPDQAPLIKAARLVNDGKPEWVIGKVKSAVATYPETPTIACLGLAFKADVDDLRESPALAIVQRLAYEGGARLMVVEPYIDSLPLQLARAEGLEMEDDAATAIAAADIVLLLVDHKPFRDITPEQLAGKVVIDTRGILRR
ncbi:UDP-N-acetyl-D-mannosamine dehydrogenase [Thiovibrio sp. JS02]